MDPGTIGIAICIILLSIVGGKAISGLNLVTKIQEAQIESLSRRIDRLERKRKSPCP